MLSQQYLISQAATLLKMAKTTRDRKVSLGLAAKAAEMKARVDDKSVSSDQVLRAPDVEGEN